MTTITRQDQISVKKALIDNTTQMCFDICVENAKNPSLSKKEISCLTKCADRYIESMVHVSKIIFVRI